MREKIRIGEEEKKGKRIFAAVCRYILWAALVAAAALTAARAITAQGRESAEADALAAYLNENEAYTEAVREAVRCQRNLMAYAGIPEEEQDAYSARIYRLAYFEEADVKTGQRTKEEEEDPFYWCRKLGGLTMEAYESMDQEGRALFTAWQISREQWKKEEEKLKEALGEQAALLSEMGEQINRLYYQQLAYLLEEGLDRGGNKAV